MTFFRKKMTVYKVVRVNKILDPNTKLSAIDELPSKFQTTYRVNRAVKAPLKGSKLYAFTSLEQAKSWAEWRNRAYNYEVWESEATGASNNIGYLPISSFVYGSYIVDYWRSICKRKAKKESISTDEVTNSGLRATGFASKFAACDTIKLKTLVYSVNNV